MSYINSIIPLIAGIVCITMPQVLTKATDKDFEKNRAKLKKVGFALVGIAVLYLLVLILSK